MISKSEIKLIRSLADRSARSEHGLFVVEGTKMVAEAVASDFEVVKIFHTAGTGSIKHSNTPAEAVSPAEMERISHLKTPPGILALLAIPSRRFDTEAMHRNLVLALDGVQDPGNLGTIIRIADWFGIDDIICSPGSADCYNPKVVQATMGALFRVHVHYMPLAGIVADATGISGVAESVNVKGISGVTTEVDAARIAAAAKVVNTAEASGTKTGCQAIQAGTIPIYGAVLGGDNIYETPLSGTGIIVMGSESHGISAEVEGLLTHRLLIPPYPAQIAGEENFTGTKGSESLNVAVATAIVCSEFRRRK